MKKTLFHIFLAISLAQTLNAQVVNIPDANFKSALLQNTSINTNKDNEIQVSEALAFSGSINVAQRNIYDLEGIQSFINLKNLFCMKNQLTTIDVSKNTALVYLSCQDNQLLSLDVSNNTALYGLNCQNNQLINLDVSKNTALNGLNCQNNELTNLDISKNINLTGLYCDNNQLTTLDVSKNTKLTTFFGENNQITTLDVSKNIALNYLGFSSNQLTTLDVSKNTALIGLYLSDNQITSLDVSKNIKLSILYCSDNQITTLDVSKNIDLEYLYCNDNQITILELSKNITLTYFNCEYNQLKILELSKNIKLRNLYCKFNQLTTLNINNKNNIILEKLDATNNPLLTCIQVDDPNELGVEWIKDNQATYSADCNVSTTDNTTIIPQFKLYPNPASQTRHIDWQGDATPIEITLYNSIGAAVKTQQLPQQGSINIADLPRGIYLCRINNANHQSQTTKIVIE